MPKKDTKGMIQLKPDVFELVKRDIDSPTIAVDKILRKYYGIEKPGNFRDMVYEEMKSRGMSRILFVQRKPTKEEVDIITKALKGRGVIINPKIIKDAMVNK